MMLTAVYCSTVRSLLRWDSALSTMRLSLRRMRTIDMGWIESLFSTLTS
jgi:hypothetical protein